MSQRGGKQPDPIPGVHGSGWVQSLGLSLLRRPVEAPSLRRLITRLKRHRRPPLCTEWLRRPRSAVESHLPIFRRAGIGCVNRGLVSGITQTIYGRGSRAGAPEPTIWFHDMLRGDGTPFDKADAELFRR